MPPVKASKQFRLSLASMIQSGMLRLPALQLIAVQLALQACYEDIYSESIQIFSINILGSSAAFLCFKRWDTTP